MLSSSLLKCSIIMSFPCLWFEVNVKLYDVISINICVRMRVQSRIISHTACV